VAVRIGHDTGIYNGTFFDLGPEAEVTIGNYCTLVGAILSTNRRVHIGDYCFLAHEVVLADAQAATPEHAGRSPDESSGIVLGENCWVGMRAVLVGSVRIGAGAIIGASAVVTFDVPPLAIVAGNPAAVVGWCGNDNRRD
jgi:acetyltransferase-like isoleucine patch superfamily enzyme